MIKRHRLLRPFTQKIDAAVDAVARKYAEGSIVDEDDFTSRLLDRIESELDGWTRGEIKFRVRKTTSKGPRSEESRLGADIVAVANVNLSDYKASKGILIQAKRLDIDRTFDNSAWDTLGKQIGDMENTTTESYVWLYDSSGVRSIKSRAVRDLATKRPDDLYPTKCSTFLGEFVQCKHGDPRIAGFFDPERVRAEFSAGHGLVISASDGDLRS